MNPAVIAIRGARDAVERHDLLLGNERRGERHSDVVMASQPSGICHYLRIWLLWELMEESVTSPEKAAIFEHLRAGRVEFPEVSLP